MEADPLVSEIIFTTDTDQALMKIVDSSPDIILLEYPTKGETGNDLIRFINTRLPDTTIVFVSKSKDHASHAIRNGVFNYLLKPLKKEDLEELTQKVQFSKKTNSKARFTEMIQKSPLDMKIRLYMKKGYFIVNTDDILFCKAAGIYSEIYMTNNRIELSYTMIHNLEEILLKFNFLRIKRSYLVNLKYIRRVVLSSNTVVLSYGGKEFEIKATREQVRELGNLNYE